MKKSLIVGALALSLFLAAAPAMVPTFGTSAALEADAAVETASSLVVIAIMAVLAGAMVIINRSLARKLH